MSYRTLIFYFGCVIAIAGLGTYLTYNGPLTTEAWQHWSGAGAWRLDFLRLIFAVLVASFILWRLGNLRSGPLNLQELRLVLPADRREWMVLYIVLGMFLYAVVIHLPASFKATMLDESTFQECRWVAGNPPLKDVHDKIVNPEEPAGSQVCGLMAGNPLLKAVHDKLVNPEEHAGFNENVELHRPAIPYFFYQVGFWFGAVWVMFFCISRTARQDWRNRRQSVVDFNQRLPSLPLTSENATLREFDVMVTAFHRRSRGLRGRAQRYLSILLIFILCLIYENLTSSRGTVLPETIEIAKLAVWILLGPVLVIFMAVIITGYHQSVEQVRRVIDQFIETLTETGANSSLLDKSRKFDEDLSTSKSGLAFLTTVIKSSSIAIPLLISILGYILQSITGGEWIDILVPGILVDYVTSLYSPQ
jgi:hypothetical protein